MTTNTKREDIDIKGGSVVVIWKYDLPAVTKQYVGHGIVLARNHKPWAQRSAANISFVYTLNVATR